MTRETIVQRYFDSWNNHDSAAIVATFVKAGTYSDPTTNGELSGDAIGQNAAQLWSGFPDVKFEIRSHMVSADGRFAAEWVMSGTNTGSFAGLPPTGRQVVLKGADFIDVSEEGIRSVQGYFDAGEVPKQLGLQIVVQPNSLGPFTFGSSVRVAGASPEAPGAFSVTSLIPRHEKDVERVQEYSQKIAVELQSMKGFLGWVGVTVGDRMLTLTAWRHPDDSRQLMQGGIHAEAIKAFFGPDVAAGGWTGLFAAHRINGVSKRCSKCGSMNRHAEETSTCSCGADLGPVPAYW